MAAKLRTAVAVVVKVVKVDVAAVEKPAEFCAETRARYAVPGAKPLNAKADFTKAISLAPKENNAYYNRGNILFQEENYAAAIADFAKAAEINPNFGKAYYALGLSYIKSNQNDKACLAFKQAQKLVYPGAAEAAKNLCQ